MKNATEYTGETIDITPTWAGVVGLHIGVLDGTITIAAKARDEAKADARTELHRMARAADLWVDHIKAIEEQQRRRDAEDRS